MQSFILFLPIVAYSIILTVMFYLEKITFNRQAFLLGVFAAVHLTLTILAGNLLFGIGQIVIAAVLFIAMVFFLGGKASGELMLTMTSLIALTPVPAGIPAAITVIALFAIFGLISLRKQKEDLSILFQQAVYSTGLAQSLPDYSNLPDRAQLDKKARKTSILPFMALVMTAFLLYHLYGFLTLES